MAISNRACQKSCSIWDAEVVVARCHSAIFRNRQSKIMSKFICGHYGLGHPVDSYCGWKRLAWPLMAVLWNISAIWGLQNGEIIFRRKLSVIYFGFGFWLSFGEILPLYYLTHYLYHLLRCTCVTEPWHPYSSSMNCEMKSEDAIHWIKTLCHKSSWTWTVMIGL